LNDFASNNKENSISLSLIASSFLPGITI
jgi:hypothetical protein